MSVKEVVGRSIREGVTYVRKVSDDEAVEALADELERYPGVSLVEQLREEWYAVTQLPGARRDSVVVFRGKVFGRL